MTEQTPPNNGQQEPGSQQDPAALAGQSQPQNPPARPDGLPDTFWDPKAGLKTKEFVESYNALAGDASKRAETFKAFPEKVEDAGKFYVLPENLLPDGTKMPEGVELKPDTTMLAQALPVLHKHRADPALFADLARAVTGARVEAFQKAAKEFVDDNAKLGAQAATRRKDIADRLTALVGDKAKFINTDAITSTAVEFFEALLSKVSSQSNVVPLNRGGGNEPPPAPKSIAERWYPPKAS